MLVRTSISEFSMRRVTKFVFSVIIYLKPEGYYLMYCDSEKRSSLKLGDLSQKPKVSF
jgi:hypothetical protein